MLYANHLCIGCNTCMVLGRLPVRAKKLVQPSQGMSYREVQRGSRRPILHWRLPHRAMHKSPGERCACSCTCVYCVKFVLGSAVREVGFFVVLMEFLFYISCYNHCRWAAITSTMVVPRTTVRTLLVQTQKLVKDTSRGS